MNISFDSCGWLYTYHLGVASYIKDNNLEVAHASGSSAGSLCAAALVSNVDVHKLTETIINHRASRNTWESATEMVKLARDEMRKHAHDNIHETVSGKLAVGLLGVHDSRRAYVMQSFKTREQLLNALCASCHIPIIGGITPVNIAGKQGSFYDGGLAFAYGLPESRLKDRITVSARGKHDATIALPIKVSMLFWGVFPPKAEVLRKIRKLGYLQAKSYFSGSDCVEIEKLKAKLEDEANVRRKTILSGICVSFIGIIAAAIVLRRR